MNSSGPSEESKADPLDHLPAALLERIRSEVAPEAVQAAAPCDLDSRGLYREGHLILAPGRHAFYAQTCRQRDSERYNAQEPDGSITTTNAQSPPRRI